MRRLWFMLLALLLAGAAQAYEIRDDTGFVTTFDTPPARVVSVLPSLTETVCALGACARLVGVDRYSNWPPEVKKLPQLGGGLDPNVEAIAALRPDVVLTATSSRAGALRARPQGGAAGAEGGADMRRVVTTLGQLLQVGRAEQLLRGIEAGVQAAAQALPPAARPARVLRGQPGAARGRARSASFIGELLDALGLVNIIGPEQSPFPRQPRGRGARRADFIMASRNSLAEMARAVLAGATCRRCAGTMSAPLTATSATSWSAWPRAWPRRRG